MCTIYRANAQLKIHLTDLRDAIENSVELPDSIESVELTERNGHIRIETTATADDVGRYTPTALLKGKISDRIVIVEDGEITHETISDRKDEAGWTEIQEDEFDEIETTTVDSVKFSGWDEDFLVNDVLRYPMFDVLRQIVASAYDGYIEGIIATDGDLTPVRYEADTGEEPVSIHIEKDKAEQKQDTSVAW